MNPTAESAQGNAVPPTGRRGPSRDSGCSSRPAPSRHSARTGRSRQAPLLLFCGFGFSYGLGPQRTLLDALPQDGQGQAFGLLGSGSMTLPSVGPARFGSVAAGIGTGGAIALPGGAHRRPDSHVAPAQSGRPRVVKHLAPTPTSLCDRDETTNNPWKAHAA
ncbi:hypothetical protein [Streptomyces sp. NPDC047976]|uniref:hypothetical protein n=1 Tax=Streptomyces sp. NPDC047976 TaxID=3155746 RepID=UPI003435F90D